VPLNIEGDKTRRPEWSSLVPILSLARSFPSTLTSSFRPAILVAAAVVACSATSATAQVFTAVPLSGVANARLQATWPTFTGVPYPEGNQTWGNIPWALGSGGNNTWFSRVASGANPRSVTIPINVSQVTSVYTLMGTWQGNTNQNLYVELEFIGSAGGTYITTFFGGVHVRDWFNGIYTNAVTSPNTAANVYSVNIGPNGGTGTSRLDMQRIDLPIAFASQSLTSLTIRDFGANPSGTFGQRSFIYGLTVNSVPSPSAAALLGLGGLLAARRRR